MHTAAITSAAPATNRATLRVAATSCVTVAAAALPGLSGSGPATTSGLSAALLTARLAAVATVGLLLAAALLSPRGEDGGLSVSAYRRLRAATAAGVWCLAAAASLLLTLSDLLGVPAAAPSVPLVTPFAVSVPAGPGAGPVGLLPPPRPWCVA